MRSVDGTTIYGALAARAGLIGQGGYLTGGEVLGDGTILARCDVFNGWVRPAGATKFVPFIRPGDNISVASVLNTRMGAYDIAGCYTNSSYIWMHSMYNLYKSINGGTTVTKVTAFPEITNENMNPNDKVGTGRQRGRYMAVDPANGDHCLIGTPTGVMRTTDGGATWTNLSTSSGLPVHGANLRTQLAFDRSSTVVSSITQRVYAFVNDTGLYKSTNGGATWTAVGGASAPTTAAHMVVHPVTGFIYTAGTASGATSGPLYRCDPAGPTWLAPNAGTDVKAIAISHSNPGHIYAQSTFGSMRVSTNYGAAGSWVIAGNNTNTLSAPKTPWLSGGGISNGELTFDPTVNRLVLLEGFGAWTSTNPPSAGSANPILWDNIGDGIDSVVGMAVDFDSQGHLHTANQDKATFNFTKLDINSDTMAAGFGVKAGLRYAGMAPDWAIDDPNFIAVAEGDMSYAAGQHGGYSTDSGRTWSPFATNSGLIWGNLAVSTKLNFAWVGGNNGVVKYTTDGGVTWTASTGFPAGYTKFINQYYLSRRILISDKNNTGHFYLFCHGDSDASVAAALGMWKSVDGGASWTRVFDKPISSDLPNMNYDSYGGKLKQVVSQPGHFLWSGGGGGTGLYKNTNYCAGTTRAAHWPKIGPMTEVLAYGVGKAKYGASYPRILAFGTGADPADSVVKLGFWVCDDGGATWTYLARIFLGRHDSVTDIAGDMTKFNRWAVSFSGSGFILLDQVHKLRMS